MVTMTSRRSRRDGCGTQRRMLGPMCLLLITSIFPASAQDATKQAGELFYNATAVPSANGSLADPALDSIGVTLTTEFDAEKLPSSATEQKKKHGKNHQPAKAEKKIAKKAAKKKKKKKKFKSAIRAADGTMHCHYKEYFGDSATEVAASTATGRNNERLLSHHDPAFALDAVKNAVNAPSPSPPVWRRQEEVGTSSAVEIVPPEASNSEETLYFQPMDLVPATNQNDFDENVVDQVTAETTPGDSSNIHKGKNVPDVVTAPVAPQTSTVSTLQEGDSTTQTNEDPNVSGETTAQTLLTQQPSDGGMSEENQSPTVPSVPATTSDPGETETKPFATSPAEASPSTVGVILSVSENQTDDFGKYVEVVQVCPAGFDNSCSDLKFSEFDESIVYKNMTVDVSLVMEIENGTTVDVREMNRKLAEGVLEDIKTCGTRRFLNVEDAGAIEESLLTRRLESAAALSAIDMGTPELRDGGSSAISFVEESTEYVSNETNTSLTSAASAQTKYCYGQHQMEGTDTECARMDSSWIISIEPNQYNSNQDEIKSQILRIINKRCKLGQIEQENVRNCALLKGTYLDQVTMFEPEEERDSFSKLEGGPESVQTKSISSSGYALIAVFGAGLLAVVLVGIHKGRSKYKEMKTTDEWNDKDGSRGTDVESTLASQTPRNLDDLHSPTFSTGSALDGKDIVQDLQDGDDGGYEIPFDPYEEQDDTVSL